MEFRGPYTDFFFDPFSVDVALQAVRARESGNLPNGSISQDTSQFSEAYNMISHEDKWAPCAASSGGQALSCAPSGGIGARVGAHPPAHVPGHGEPCTYGIGGGGEVVGLAAE
jgi:hypothetical protein